jgi:hypothetical protein
MAKTFNDVIPFSSAFSFDGIHQRQESRYISRSRSDVHEAMASTNDHPSHHRLNNFIATVSKQTLASIANKEV